MESTSEYLSSRYDEFSKYAKSMMRRDMYRRDKDDEDETAPSVLDIARDVTKKCGKAARFGRNRSIEAYKRLMSDTTPANDTGKKMRNNSGNNDTSQPPPPLSGVKKPLEKPKPSEKKSQRSRSVAVNKNGFNQDQPTLQGSRRMSNLSTTSSAVLPLIMPVPGPPIDFQGHSSPFIQPPPAQMPPVQLQQPPPPPTPPTQSLPPSPQLLQPAPPAPPAPIFQSPQTAQQEQPKIYSLQEQPAVQRSKQPDFAMPPLSQPVWHPPNQNAPHVQNFMKTFPPPQNTNFYIPQDTPSFRPLIPNTNIQVPQAAQVAQNIPILPFTFYLPRCCMGMYPIPHGTQTLTSQCHCPSNLNRRSKESQCPFETSFQKQEDCQNFDTKTDCTSDETSVDCPICFKTQHDKCHPLNGSVCPKKNSKCSVEKAVYRKLIRLIIGQEPPSDIVNTLRTEYCKNPQSTKTDLDPLQGQRVETQLNNYCQPPSEICDPNIPCKLQQRFITEKDKNRMWLEQCIPVIGEAQSRCSKFPLTETTKAREYGRSIGIQCQEYQEISQLSCTGKSLNGVQNKVNKRGNIRRCNNERYRTIQLSIKNKKKKSKPICLNVDLDQLLKVTGTNPQHSEKCLFDSNCGQETDKNTQSTQCDDLCNETNRPYFQNADFNCGLGVIRCRCKRCVPCNCSNASCSYENAGRTLKTVHNCVENNSESFRYRQNCANSDYGNHQPLGYNEDETGMIIISPCSHQSNGTFQKKQQFSAGLCFKPDNKGCKRKYDGLNNERVFQNKEIEGSCFDKNDSQPQDRECVKGCDRVDVLPHSYCMDQLQSTASVHPWLPNFSSHFYLEGRQAISRNGVKRVHTLNNSIDMTKNKMKRESDRPKQMEIDRNDKKVWSNRSQYNTQSKKPNHRSREINKNNRHFQTTNGSQKTIVTSNGGLIIQVKTVKSKLLNHLQFGKSKDSQCQSLQHGEQCCINNGFQKNSSYTTNRSDHCAHTYATKQTYQTNCKRRGKVTETKQSEKVTSQRSLPILKEHRLQLNMNESRTRSLIIEQRKEEECVISGEEHSSHDNEASLQYSETSLRQFDQTSTRHADDTPGIESNKQDVTNETKTSMKQKDKETALNISQISDTCEFMSMSSQEPSYNIIYEKDTQISTGTNKNMISKDFQGNGSTTSTSMTHNEKQIHSDKNQIMSNLKLTTNAKDEETYNEVSEECEIDNMSLSDSKLINNRYNESNDVQKLGDDSVKSKFEECSNLDIVPPINKLHDISKKPQINTPTENHQPIISDTAIFSSISNQEYNENEVNNDVEKENKSHSVGSSLFVKDSNVDNVERCSGHRTQNCDDSLCYSQITWTYSTNESKVYSLGEDGGTSKEITKEGDPIHLSKIDDDGVQGKTKPYQRSSAYENDKRGEQKEIKQSNLDNTETHIQRGHNEECNKDLSSKQNSDPNLYPCRKCIGYTPSRQPLKSRNAQKQGFREDQSISNFVPHSDNHSCKNCPTYWPGKTSSHLYCVSATSSKYLNGGITTPEISKQTKHYISMPLSLCLGAQNVDEKNASDTEIKIEEKVYEKLILRHEMNSILENLTEKKESGNIKIDIPNDLNPDHNETKAAQNDVIPSPSILYHVSDQRNDKNGPGTFNTDLLLKTFEQETSLVDTTEPEGGLKLSSITLSSNINDMDNADTFTKVSKMEEDVSCFSEENDEFDRGNYSAEINVRNDCFQERDLSEAICESIKDMPFIGEISVSEQTRYSDNHSSQNDPKNLLEKNCLSDVQSKSNKKIEYFNAPCMNCPNSLEGESLSQNPHSGRICESKNDNSLKTSNDNPSHFFTIENDNKKGDCSKSDSKPKAHIQCRNKSSTEKNTCDKKIGVCPERPIPKTRCKPFQPPCFDKKDTPPENRPCFENPFREINKPDKSSDTCKPEESQESKIVSPSKEFPPKIKKDVCQQNSPSRSGCSPNRNNPCRKQSESNNHPQKSCQQFGKKECCPCPLTKERDKHCGGKKRGKIEMDEKVNCVEKQTCNCICFCNCGVNQNDPEEKCGTRKAASNRGNEENCHLKKSCTPCHKQEKNKNSELNDSDICNRENEREEGGVTATCICKTQGLDSDHYDSHLDLKETYGCTGFTTGSSYDEFLKNGRDTCCVEKCHSCLHCRKLNASSCTNVNKRMTEQKMILACNECEGRICNTCKNCGRCRDRCLPLCSCELRSKQIRMCYKVLAEQKRSIGKKDHFVCCCTQPDCSKFCKKCSLVNDLRSLLETSTHFTIPEIFQSASSSTCQCQNESIDDMQYESCKPSTSKHLKHTKEFFKSIHNRCSVLRNMLSTKNLQDKSKSARIKAKSLLHIYILRRSKNNPKSFQIEL